MKPLAGFRREAYALAPPAFNHEIDNAEKNQLGRRNLTADARKLILGRRYNRQKKATTDGGKGTAKATVDQNEPRLSTAEKLAAENHVSPATVKRAGKFAEEADKKPNPFDIPAPVWQGVFVLQDLISAPCRLFGQLKPSGLRQGADFLYH